MNSIDIHTVNQAAGVLSGVRRRLLGFFGLTVVLALGAGIGVGVVSQEPLPAGGITRQEAIDFFEERGLFALTANILFGVGGAFVAAAVLWIGLDWRRVFGAPPEGEAGGVALYPRGLGVWVF